MADVFISYAREDLESAQALAALLQGHGWSVWWDRDLVPGNSFDEVIERELTAAAAVVVLWSEAAVGSSWVRSEAHAAADRDVLVPVLLDDVEVPLRYRIVQGVDLRGWDRRPNDARLPALVAGVHALAGPPPIPARQWQPPDQQVDVEVDRPGPPTVATAPGSSGVRHRRRPLVWLLVGAVAAAAVAAIAVWSQSGTDGSSTTLVTVVEPSDPEAAALAQLQSLITNDESVVASLAEQWVPQLSSKELGLEWEGVTYTYQEILREHLDLREEHGAVLVDGGGEYNFKADGEPMVGWYITVVPEGDPEPDRALEWCTDQGIDRFNCFAKLLTVDQGVEDTVVLNP